MTTTSRLLIIRHGESNAQLGGFIPGHDSCSGLSDKGRKQVRLLCERLIRTNEVGDGATVHSSVLRRAVESATPVAEALGSVGLEVSCELCELHAGAAEGMTWEDVQARLGPSVDVEDPYARLFPGMESWADMYARVGSHLLGLVARNQGGTIVVVGHGGTAGAAFAALGRLGVQDAFQLSRATANASITEWRRRRGPWRLVRFGDAAHLATTDADAVNLPPKSTANSL